MMEVVERLDMATQREILAQTRQLLKMSPLQTMIMPARGIARRANCTGVCTACNTVQPGDRTLSPQSTNFGDKGWISNRCGYFYVDTHPLTGEAFPPIPPLLVELARRIAREYAGEEMDPQSAYLNWYRAGGRLGLHTDNAERVNKPVISISIGADAVFLAGGTQRSDPIRTIMLHSGDILVMAGPDRYAFHGIERIFPETTPPELGLTHPGRINLTIRQYA